MIDVIPGIFETQWSDMEKKIALVSSLVDWVQIEISDGTLVPTNTLVKLDKLDKFAKSLSFEAHLMVAYPVKYIRPLADSGFKRLIAHIECQDPRAYLDSATYESIEACLAIDSQTDVEQIEPFLEEVDGVLVMTAEAGETGSVFQPETVEKIRLIRQHFADLPIEAEGGINNVTAKIITEAGATRLVSTIYLFADLSRIAQAVARLKS